MVNLMPYIVWLFQAVCLCINCSLSLWSVDVWLFAACAHLAG